MAFVDVNKDDYTLSEYVDDETKYPGCSEEQKVQYNVCKESHFISFAYMSYGPKCVTITFLKFFPYARESGFVVEKYLYNTRFKKFDLPLKEIIQCTLCDIGFTKYSK